MKKKQLEVDFIGGTGPLTKEEEKLISDFINARKKKANAQNRMAQRSGFGKKADKRIYIPR